MNSNRFLKNSLVAPRAAQIINRFPGNVRQDLLEALLDLLWTSVLGQLADPVRVEENDQCRIVTFMGAIRFTIDKRTARVELSRLENENGQELFVQDANPTVIDLPAKLTGYWLDPFLVPWAMPIDDCFVCDGSARSGPSWHESIKRELQRALGRSTHWYRLRCHLCDALKLDPQIILWCRKGRPTYRDFVTQAQYNQVLAERTIYQRIQDDNPNLIWLYNFLRAENLQPAGDQPVAGMKAWLLEHKGVTESSWRLIANSKVQNFQHLIDFVDADGRISGRHEWLPRWLRMLDKLHGEKALPRPLLRLFVHDMYDGMRTGEGDRVRFRGVIIQPGVLRAILQEGKRRIQNGSHGRFIDEDVVEVATWLQAENPVLDKKQIRQSWKYLASQAAKWKVEREASDTLKDLAWDSLLPEIQIGQWRIVPLTDAWQLRREALAQRHCADHYLEECLAGDYRLFGVRTGQGKRVATIGIERAGESWKVFGFRGFANRKVPETLLGVDKEVLRRYSDLWQLTLPAALPLPSASPTRPLQPLKEPRLKNGEVLLSHSHIALLEGLASLPGTAAPSYRAWIDAAMPFSARYDPYPNKWHLLRGCHSISHHWVSCRRVGSSIATCITDRGLEIVSGVVPAAIRGKGHYSPRKPVPPRVLPTGEKV